MSMLFENYDSVPLTLVFERAGEIRIDVSWRRGRK